MDRFEDKPALLYGLALTLGTLFALSSPLALIPLPLILHKKYVLPVTLLFLFPLAYLHTTYHLPPTKTVVSGTFHIHSRRPAPSFTKGWTHRGTLKTKEGKLYGSLTTPDELEGSHNLTALAFTNNERFYTFKPLSISPNNPRSNYRLHAKTWVANYIERHFANKRAANFLTGMVTGELDDPELLHTFGQLGLSHIMAISGFHFALLTLAIHLILRLFLPAKPEAITLIILLTTYLLFVGPSPSILRAWTVATIFLLGQLLERPPHPLNSLGAALIVIILINPLQVTTLSFQLSFLATAGILLLYRPLQNLLTLWIPTYPLSQTLSQNIIFQHAYLLTRFMRNALALTLAVHLALLPLLLATFHTLPLNGLIYNLFFPLLASWALFLFIAGILTGGLLHPLNNLYCELLLKLTESPPLLLKGLYYDGVTPLMLTLYLTLLFGSALWFGKRKVDNGLIV